MSFQKWGERSQISNPRENASQHLLKPNRPNKNLPMTADPISPINKERIAFQIKYEKENFPSLLFALQVHEGMEYDALNSLLQIHHSHKESKTPNDIINLVFAASYLPSSPGIIFIESSDKDSCVSIIKEAIKKDNSNSIFLSNCIKSLKELNNFEIFDSFCYPIQYLSLSVGSIVRIKDPEFQNEPAQIVNVNSDTGYILVKMYGHIDYNNLHQFNLTSQKALNLKMPNNYRADPAPFEESFFYRHSAKIEVKPVKISMAPRGVVDMIYWDGNYYCDKFMYIEFPIKNIITQNLDITEEEFQRFADSRVSWEIVNNGFVEHMNKTAVIRSNNNNLQAVQLTQLDIGNGSISQSVSSGNNNLGISSSYSLQNEVNILPSPPPSPPPSLPSAPSTPTLPTQAIEKEKKSKSKSTQNQTEKKQKKQKKKKDEDREVEKEEEKEEEEKPKDKKKKKTKIKSAKDLTIGSTGIITSRNLPCTIKKIINNTLVVDPNSITIAGNAEAFREPGKYEMAIIEKEKYELELTSTEKPISKSIQVNLLQSQTSGNTQKVKRKKKVHSILSESDTDSDEYYSYEYNNDEEEEEPKKQKKKSEVNSNDQSRAIQTDSLTYRHLDLIKMKNGSIGVIISPLSTLKLNVHLTTNQVLENVELNDINKVIPDQGFVLDLSGRQILLNDNVFYNDQIRTVIRMHNRKLFVRDDRDSMNPSYEWIEASKALTNYLSKDLLMDRKDSLIGKSVHKITNGRNSHSYKVEAVSKKGYLLSSDENGIKIKFRFNEIEKLWSFDKC